ncbi:MAG: ATP-binding cassette domain-containing protein [Proteobacteria bacterium]|nr:ATP-binding cassette domain-containing protein [Pseudomonadota bacterium]NOG59981.1 ATP-binding cassette domain-containing protein [Pseudomonadota bacterium]
MPLITFDEISLEFGDQMILNNVSMALEPGERVCLIGRNGAGKSTLINIINDKIEPDSGEIVRQSHLRVSQLEQALPEIRDISVRDYVAEGLNHLQLLLKEYEILSHKDIENNPHLLREIEDLQHQIEAEGGWNIDQRVETIISELNLPAELKMDQLSGGWRRRVALGKALVSNPQLLLLDEPTNHLDLSTIEWLENRFKNFNGAILFITHDRAFLQKLATRIIELDRGKLSSWPGTYHDYLINKEKALEEEAKTNALFDKKLNEEEVWIRQGIKARRTRNEGRVRSLEAMRKEVAKRLKPQNKARIHIEEAEQSGRKVIEAHRICHSYGEQQLIDKLSLKIMRGDRIGLVGNNGVGKSTLLKILLGEIEPNSGTVKIGTNLEVAYFDQLRRNLDPEKTIAQIVGEGGDYIKINGKDRHVIGYLRGFLFTAKRAMTKIKVLSGGEKNRVILAKLLTKPSNLLVLDEPTNDLDVETLEVLEERLSEYKGTLIVVSHDREFVDNVVSSILVFEDSGVIQNYAGGFSDWARHGKHLAEMDNPIAKKENSNMDNKNKKRSGNKKLSYKLKLELDSLPDKIETLEKEIGELEAQTNEDDFYSKPYEEQQPVLDEMKMKQDELDDAIYRWAELENMENELQS